MNPPPKSQSDLLAQLNELEEKGLAAEQELQTLRSENRALREAERKSRAWLEHSPVCTKVLDLDFNLLYMSQAGVFALALDRAEDYYCQPYPIEFFPEFFRSSMREALIKVRETGNVGHQEAPIITLAGEEKWFRSIIAPVFNEEQVVEYILVVSIDITDQLKAEKHRVELERQVQHAQKLESLGVLSGGIAHDFNNLLMSVLGNVDLALDSIPKGHPAHQNLKEVENAARRGAELADQMLAYSGRGKFVIEPICLNDFLAEMTKLLEVTLSKKAELRLDLPENLPSFDGDPTQIRQVIMNLLTNASEALGDHPGLIHVSAGTMDCDHEYLNQGMVSSTGPENMLEEGPYVYFEIADNGCGMDEATRAKIFEPFFTTKFTGRGLGMAAVLGIVHGHHGTIRVSSAPNKGSLFRVLFPQGATSIAGVMPSTQQSSAPKDWRSQGTVLIVDDEEGVCAVGKEMLQHFGFDVLSASNGTQAIEIFLKHADAISCVLLDLTMPDLDGEQVFQELKKMDSEVKVILTSGYNRDDIAKRFQEQGLSGFLQKPFDLDSLQSQLAKVLGD